MGKEFKRYETFEDAYLVIDEMLNKRKGKWTLSSISYMDYFDVSQIIRIHLWKKFDQYDRNLPLEPWVSTIISRQMINIRRNHYDTLGRPCLRCAASEGEDLCAIYTKQCNSCPLYAHWEKSKKSAYNINMPLSVENHQQEVYELPNRQDDTEKMEKNLHEIMLRELKPNEAKIYKLLYIQNLSDQETAQKMGYTKENKNEGCIVIAKIKKVIISKVKQLRINGELDLTHEN